MKIRPLGDRVIVRPDELPDMIGLIHVPPQYRKKVAENMGMRGTVVAAGPGMPMKNGKRWPMPVAAGDRVVFQFAGSQKVRIGDEDLLATRDDFILAVEEVP